MEQEVASIAKYMIENSGGAYPYYWKIPEGFMVPSIYFPEPEVASYGDTFTSFRYEYSWYVKVFSNNDQQAHNIALKIIDAIVSNRNLIPLVDETGEPLPYGVRIKNPEMKNIEDSPSAVQLYIRWQSSRPYCSENAKRAMDLIMSISAKGYD